MKINLREYIEPSNQQLDAFDALIDSHAGRGCTEDGFARLMKRVNAAEALQTFRSEEAAPQSIKELADAACGAFALSTTGLTKALRISVQRWASVVNHARMPQKLPPQAYVRLASLCEVGYGAIESAIRGSYRLFLARSPEMHPRFALSSLPRTQGRDYARGVREAYRELQDKSRAYRRRSDCDTLLTGYLAEVRERFDEAR
jgi:hypothetical protein